MRQSCLGRCEGGDEGRAVGSLDTSRSRSWFLVHWFDRNGLSIAMDYQQRAARRRETWTSGVVKLGEEAEQANAAFLAASSASDRLTAIFELSMTWLDAEAGTRLQRSAHGLRRP